MFGLGAKRQQAARESLESAESLQKALASHCESVYITLNNFDLFQRQQVLSLLYDLQGISGTMQKLDIDQHKFGRFTFKLVKPLNYVIIEE